MHIAVVGPSSTFRGGIALFTSQLVSHLRRRHVVDFFSFRRLYPSLLFPGNSSPHTSEDRIDVQAIPCIDGLNPLTWRRTAKEMVSRRPDVLLLQWWTPYWLPLYRTFARRARAAGIPVLTIAHQLVEPDSSFGEFFVARLALRTSDGLVVMGEMESCMAHRLFPEKPTRLAAMPPLAHGELRGHGREQARRALGVHETAPLLLFFGFVRRYKGLRHLLRALSEAPDVHLVVAGEFWENESEYRAEIDRLKVADRVTVFNRYIHNEEVERFFVAADALVLPYTSGSLSAVAVTALSYGLPIIASDVGGLRDLVADGEVGLVVPPGHAGELARAIRVFFDDGLAKGFCDAIDGRSHRLTWAHLVGAVEEVADEVVNRARASD